MRARWGGYYFDEIIPLESWNPDKDDEGVYAITYVAHPEIKPEMQTLIYFGQVTDYVKDKASSGRVLYEQLKKHTLQAELFVGVLHTPKRKQGREIAELLIKRYEPDCNKKEISIHA